MIATRTEIKALLAMTSSAQDDLINRLIPIIEDDIREICNNGFRDEGVYFQSSDITFTRNSTSADVLTFDGSGTDGFLSSNFKNGQTIQVQGSYNNDGWHEVETVSSTALTMYTSTNRPYFQEMVTEDEELYIVINKVLYPRALKSVMAQMVRYKLKNYDYNVKSERVSRYSVEYAIDQDGGYPKTIISGLYKWTRPVVV